MRWFIDLAYRGAPFHGWQIQPGEITVQSVLEEALSRLARRPVAVTGAGRTDAGVNASMMIAHVDLPDGLEPDSRFLHSLNSMVGRDIAVRSFTPVHADAHARFDATERRYHYYANTRKSAFVWPLSWQAPPALDFDAMNRAGVLMLGTRDFSSFAKTHTDVKTHICDLRRVEWEEVAPGRWRLIVVADRFLRNMVRAIAGTLADVGRGKLAPDDLPEIIARRDRCAAGTSMPAHALFLSRITYPYYTVPDEAYLEDI